jgi:hypothetical protein
VVHLVVVSILKILEKVEFCVENGKSKAKIVWSFLVPFWPALAFAEAGISQGGRCLGGLVLR